MKVPFAALFLFICSACAKPPAPPVKAELLFDYEMATEVSISKNDPRTGDRWTTRVTRTGDLWTIELGPSETQNGDRVAYGGYILHLLDTLRTIGLTEVKLKGTPESFGLSPPLFDLRWKSPDNFALQLGAPAKSASTGQFEGLYASYQGKIYVAQGAALRMLDMLASFDDLRLKSLATFASDDVDEIESRRFYAQRDGDRWTGRGHRPIKTNIGETLDQITHLRVLRFVDDPAEQKKWEDTLSKNPVRTLLFRGRGRNSIEMRFAKRESKVVADLSTRTTREGARVPFEIYPEALSALSRLK